MSYNIHLKIVPKRDLEKVKGFKTYQEILNAYDKKDRDMEEYIGVYDLFKGYSDFCFGSDESWVQQIYKKHGTEVLSAKDLRGHFDGDFFEISVEGFADIIEFYKEDVGTMYKEKLSMVEYLMENPEKSGNDEYKDKLKSVMSLFYFKTQDWGKGGLNTQPYNKNKNSNTLLNSNSYEYMIFELVRLYKSLDLENESVIIYGY